MMMRVGVMMIVALPPSKQTCSPQIVPVLKLVFLLMTEFVLSETRQQIHRRAHSYAKPVCFLFLSRADS